MSPKKIYIITPVYNEEKYIGKFLEKLMPYVSKTKQVNSVLIVNDGSRDNTKQIILKHVSKHKKLSIISHKKNLGKGRAMKTGLSYAQKSGADCVIFMDGDMQHDPKYIATFLKKINTFEIVFGYRKLSRNAPFIRKYGNKAVGILVKKLFNIKRKDLLCGFMAMRKEVFHKISWNSNGYGVEAELAILVAQSKIVYKEIFISTIYLDKNKGVTIKDAIKILIKIPYWYMQSYSTRHTNQ